MRILKTLSVKAAVNVAGNLKYSRMEPLHSGGQHLCKFIETKESVYITKEFNSHRFGTPKWPPFHCFGTPIWSPSCENNMERAYGNGRIMYIP